MLLLIVAMLAAGPAAAEDLETIIKKVEKFQTFKNHKGALSYLERMFKDKDMPPKIKMLKAASLEAIGKPGEAFNTLASARGLEGPEGDAIRKKLTALGSTLPEQTFKVLGEPKGATVLVGRRSLGEIPVRVQVRPGYHDLRITKVGYKAIDKRIFVMANAPFVFTASLEAMTGKVVVEVDQDGLSGTVAGKTQALKRGKNTFENVPAGKQTIVVTKGGKEILRKEVSVPAGGEVGTGFSAFGTVKTPWSDATIEIAEDDKDKDDKKKGEAKPQKGPELKLREGQYMVIVRRPGYYPVKGKLDVQAGKAATITSSLEKIPDRSTLEIGAIIGVSVSIAAVVTATVLELAEVGREGAGEIAKFTLAGVGGAGFIASGALLKWSRDDRLNPDPKDTEFSVRFGAAFLRDGGMLTATGGF